MTEASRIIKAPDAFRTISEVSETLDVPQHVLRFWETKFPEVKPLKRSGGRRYYRPQDVDLLRRIRQHRYEEGYTIRGVQKLLREGGLRGEESSADAKRRPKPPPLERMARVGETTGSPGPARRQLLTALEDLRRELLEIRALLVELLAP